MTEQTEAPKELWIGIDGRGYKPAFVTEDDAKAHGWNDADGATAHKYVRADLTTVERDRLAAENVRLRAALAEAANVKLNELMLAAGMIPLDAITKPDELSCFEIHAGMTDLSFYEVWLERKASEYGRMQAAHQTEAREMPDDIADFVLGKAGAFQEALLNFRAALTQKGEQA